MCARCEWVNRLCCLCMHVCDCMYVRVRVWGVGWCDVGTACVICCVCVVVCVVCMVIVGVCLCVVGVVLDECALGCCGVVLWCDMSDLLVMV